MKIKKEDFYLNEFAKEEELAALKKQYPAMFANKRANQFANINLNSDIEGFSDSSSDNNAGLDKDIYG